MPPRKPTGTGPSGRGLTVRVKTAKRRSVSSARWLQRQLNDPYVAEAQRRGFRSRAAFKLTQIDEKFGLLRRGLRAVDLGAAPGGWTQIAVDKVKAGAGGPGGGRVVGIDYMPMDPITGAQLRSEEHTSDLQSLIRKS